MAIEGVGLRDGAMTTAAADLSAKQFYAVKLTANNAVNLANTGGEDIYGILQNTPKSGEAAEVCFAGICQALGNATVAVGQKLMTDTSGKLIAWISGNTAVGINMENFVAGQIFTMRVVQTYG